MTQTDLGPRRQELLRAWGEYAATTPQSVFHDFGPENRNERVRDRLESFLASPSETTFEALWSRNVLRDAVMGGSSLVLNTWPGTLDELAARFERMRTADEYDSSWEDDIVAETVIWELYGHMDPTNRPILNSQVISGLDSLGFSKPVDYQNRRGFERFADVYESIVGHATATTDHEVPWYFELEQFLVMVGTKNQYNIHSELPIDQEYPKVVGWEAEGDAGKITFADLDPLLDKYTESRRWIRKRRHRAVG